MGLYDDQKRTIGSVLESRESERKREDEILRRLLGAKANSHTETLECDPVIPIALPHDQLGRRR